MFTMEFGNWKIRYAPLSASSLDLFDCSMGTQKPRVYRDVRIKRSLKPTDTLSIVRLLDGISSPEHYFSITASLYVCKD